jgi:dienelactone hydrolase
MKLGARTPLAVLVGLLAATPLLAGARTVVQVQIPVNDPVHHVTTISGWLYGPDQPPASPLPAVVLAHGCSGIWSGSTPPATPPAVPNLQNQIEKWAMKLADTGYYALVVDSFTSRFDAARLDVYLDGDLASAWQNQCSNTTIHADDMVDKYTTRANDIHSAYQFLALRDDVDAINVGLMGWSAGAEASMIELGMTPRDSKLLKPESEYVYKTAVLFYPGCGASLGFGNPTSSTNPSWWRPYTDTRSQHGKMDTTVGWTNCDARKARAIDVYGAVAGSGRELVFMAYDGAKHSFDGVSETWPTSACNPYVAGDSCAMRDADIKSLQYFEDHLKQ